MTTCVERAAPLAAYQGTYLGFAPTDESAIAMGEIELVIAANAVSIRMATGLKIQMESVDIATFTPMTHEEIAAEYNPGSDIPSELAGFKTDGPKLLFMKDREAEGPGLIVRTGGMAELLGPTVLFNPVQVARGDFERVVASIEERAGKGVLPRLRNNGKAERT